jgi:hypothetical protein
MKDQYTNTNTFQKIILILGILAGLSLFGYALVNLIRMPAVSPDAFVPKDLAHSGRSIFGLLQFIFVLGFSFSFLPVSVMFTIRRYSDNPHAVVIGCSLLCFALIIEIINSLPFLGNYIYPEPLAQIPPDVLLYLNQSAAIRYLSFDVAGFTVLYVSLFVFAVIYWNSKRIMSRLVIASIVIFTASAPFLWIAGNIAVALMAISIFCLVPIPVYFGQMAVE